METKGTECRFRVWLPNDLTGVLYPVTQGTQKSQKSTVFGKGLLLELNIESGRPLLELEALDVISEAEFRNR